MHISVLGLFFFSFFNYFNISLPSSTSSCLQFTPYTSSDITRRWKERYTNLTFFWSRDVFCPNFLLTLHVVWFMVTVYQVLCVLYLIFHSRYLSSPVPGSMLPVWSVLFSLKITLAIFLFIFSFLIFRNPGIYVHNVLDSWFVKMLILFCSTLALFYLLIHVLLEHKLLLFPLPRYFSVSFHKVHDIIQ